MHKKKLIILLMFVITFMTGFTFGNARQPPVKYKIIKIEKIVEVEKEVLVEKVGFKPLDIPLDEEIQEYIYNLCEEIDLEFELALALFKLESNFNHNTINHNNNNTYDIGIGQLNSKYFIEYGERAGIENFDPYNIKHNIKASLYGLKHYIDYWSNKGLKDEELTKMALLSYNRGLNGAKNYRKKYGIDHSYNKIVLKHKEYFLSLNNK